MAQGKETSDLELDEKAPEDSGANLTGIPEFIRRAFAAGLSGFFLTEEAIRKTLGESVPKDWTDFAVDQSNRARAEFLERLSYELGRSIENMDLATVLTQLLEGRTLEVKAEIRLVASEDGGRQVRLEVDRGKKR